jgi:hypothetical protein
MRRARLATITLTAIGLGLASPTGAPAAVTIGSNLQNPPNQTFNCSGMNLCTVNLSALPAARQALGGLVAPINGVVVAWTIRIGASTEPVSFRAIRPVGGSFTGVATLPAVTPPISSTTSYSARVPVMAGDGIGLNCCQGGNGQLLNDAGAPNGSTFRYWNPVLGDGAGPFPSTATQTPAQYELTLQATIEPDTDKGRLRRRNPGQLPGNPRPLWRLSQQLHAGQAQGLEEGQGGGDGDAARSRDSQRRFPLGSDPGDEGGEVEAIAATRQPEPLREVSRGSEADLEADRRREEQVG